MNAPVRIAAYGAILALVLAGGWLVGARTDLGELTATAAEHSTTSSNDPEDAGNSTTSSQGAVPGGLQVSEGGYTLALPRTDHRPGRQQVRFQILGPDGAPVTDYDRNHDKDLHLIVVRRDFTGFQHVHPVLDRASGSWSVTLGLTPGSWRIFADFVPAGGQGRTLGADLLVAGDPGPQPLPTPTRTAQVDGYTVVLRGDLVAGEHSMLDLELTRSGVPVTDLEPYLGAYGHLVALREGDLAYLHVHPGADSGDGRTTPGPRIEFGVQVPSAGRYHLYLDFQVDGAVRTAAFTVDARTGVPTGEHSDGHSHG